MMSKKLTFSLACLALLIAIGFAGVLPTHAAVLGENFTVTYGVTDESTEPGIQVEYDRASVGLTAILPVDHPGSDPIVVPITFGKQVIFNDSAYDDNIRLGPDDIQVTLYSGLTGQPLEMTYYGAPCDALTGAPT